MKTRIMFKCMFLIVLLFLLIGLTIIIFSDNSIYKDNRLKLEDYKIVYDSECKNEINVIYEDDKNKYIINCDLNNIHLKWDYGNIDSLNTALKYKKVTIDSLKSHGLKIIEIEK